MMVSIHHHLETARRLESLTVHGLSDRIHFGRAGLSYGSAEALIAELGDELNEELIVQIKAMERGQW